MPRRTIKCSSCNVKYWSGIIARESLTGMESHRLHGCKVH
jgi:hypothetical protein